MPKEPKPWTKRWEERANDMARGFCPPIFPCKKCEQPVIHGYCCDWCGDTNPTKAKEDE